MGDSFESLLGWQQLGSTIKSQVSTWAVDFAAAA
tara:strand:+ start:244 stop:345 length:102 start_codon:yes stop_codon:yes gene_type:complete